MPPTGPTSLTVTAQASNAISLAWAAGVGGSFYDVYRAVSATPGFFGDFVKINDAPVAGTTYVDNAANSTPDPVVGNHYAYFVRNVVAADSFSQSNLVFGSTFENTDAVASIVAAAKTRMGSVLGSGWSEMDFSIDPEKQSKRQKDNKYAFTPGDGSQSAAQVLNSFSLRQIFTIQMMKRAVDRASDAAAVQAGLDIFQDLLRVLQDFQLSRLGLPGLVFDIDLPSFEEPGYSEGNTTVILTSRVAVSYRITN